MRFPRGRIRQRKGHNIIYWIKYTGNAKVAESRGNSSPDQGVFMSYRIRKRKTAVSTEEILDPDWPRWVGNSGLLLANKTKVSSSQ